MRVIRRTKSAFAAPVLVGRQGRIRKYLGLGLLATVILTATVAASCTGGQSAEQPAASDRAGGVPVGQKVEPVKLEDSRTGTVFDLGEYLGKREIVLVAYMGDF